MKKRSTTFIGLSGHSLVIICCLLLVQQINAQVFVPTITPQQNAIKPDTTIVTDNKMDAIDLFKIVFKIKKKPKKPIEEKNFFYTAIPYVNYTIATGFAAVAPFNLSFHINKKERKNLSFFNNNFQYTQKNQILVQSLSNVFFGQHDKWELIGDLRFFRFPTYTYGLGTATPIANPDEIDYSQIRVYETIMWNVHKDIEIGAGYHWDYHYDVKDINAEHGEVTEFEQYGYAPTSSSSGISVDFLYDSRDDPNNPRDGSYINFQLRTYLKVLGSTSNWRSLIVDYRRYVKVPTKYWISSLAFWFYSTFTIDGKPPYLDLPYTAGDSYNNTGRGYALGRYRGLDELYFEVEYRFDILKTGLLGGVLFANAETFTDWPVVNFNGVAPGIGAGIRIKINKRTNTNACVDYGFGTQGSKGFAFNLNEVY